MILISPVRVALATALCMAATVVAANSADGQSIEQQQIQALQRQLAAVQAQMKQLAEQNQPLLQKELELERQVTQRFAAAQSPVAPPTMELSSRT